MRASPPVLALAIALVVARATHAEAATVHIDAGTLTASIANGLRAEVADVTIAPEAQGADVEARVVRDGGSASADQDRIRRHLDRSRPAAVLHDER